MREMSPKAILFYFCFILALLIGASSFFYLTINVFLQFFGSAGGFVSATAIFLLLIRNLPSFQKSLAPVLSSFGWIKKAELASIAYNIQGNINQFREVVNLESPDLIPEAQVEWISRVKRESFFDDYKAKVIVRMEPSKDNNVNLAKATLLQVSKGVIPESREYIEPKMSVSIDLSLVKKILLKQNEKNAYRYFMNEIAVPELEDEEVIRYLEKMELIDNAGLFTRLFLRELKELPVIRGLTFQNISEIRTDVKNFFAYTEIVAKRKPHEHIPLQYEGAYIKTAIIYVAIARRMDKEGLKPYIRRALINREDGIEIIFFISFSHAIDFTRRVVDVLTKSYGMDLIENTDSDFIIDGQRYICATVLVNTDYVLRPQDDLLLHDLLASAINETLSESGWANLDSVETKLKEKSPDFNVSDHGFSTLKELFEALKLFELQMRKIDDEPSKVLVRCKDTSQACVQESSERVPDA